MTDGCQGAVGRRSREAAAVSGRCLPVGAGTVGRKIGAKAETWRRNGPEAGQRMTEKRNLSARVGIEAKGPKVARRRRSPRAGAGVAKVRKSLAVRAPKSRRKMSMGIALRPRSPRRARTRSKGEKAEEERVACGCFVAELPCFKKSREAADL